MKSNRFIDINVVYTLSALAVLIATVIFIIWPSVWGKYTNKTEPVTKVQLESTGQIFNYMTKPEYYK